MAKHSRKFLVWLFVLVFIGLFFFTRLYGLTTKYPGIDEKWTLRYGYDALHGKLLETAYNDSYPPLFYLLSGLSLLFDYSLVSLRVLMIFLGLVLLVAFYFFARLYADKRTSLFLTFLLTFHPMTVLFSQHPRPYILLMLYFVASLYLCTLILRLHEARPYFLLGLVYALALYTHYYSIFFIAVEVLYLLYHHVMARRLRLGLLMSALLGVALVFSFWLPVFFAQYRHLISQGAIALEKLTLMEVPYPFYKMTLMADLSSTVVTQYPVLLLGSVLIGVLMLRGLYLTVRQQKVGHHFLAWTFIGFSLLSMTLGFFIPVYSFRYLSVLLPLFVFYLGKGILFKNKWVTFVLIFLVLFLWAFILASYFSELQIPLWRDDFAV